MNDSFYFIQKCDFVNYADDDTLSEIASTMESLMEYLIHDNESCYQLVSQKCYGSKSLKVQNYVT